MVAISQTKVSSFSDCDQCFEGSSIPITSLISVLLYLVTCLVLEVQDHMNWKDTESKYSSLLDDWRHCPRVMRKFQTPLTTMGFRIDIKPHIQTISSQIINPENNIYLVGYLTFPQSHFLHLGWSAKVCQRNGLKLELTIRYWLLLMKKRSPQSPVVVLTSMKYSGVASDQTFPSR